jgi:hypothetical protein
MSVSGIVAHRFFRPLVTEASRSSFYPGDPGRSEVFYEQVKARVAAFPETQLP